MKKDKLDKIDKKLLNILQMEIPIERYPFSELAREIGAKEAEVIKRVKQLKSKRIIRYISPVFDARSLGFTSTLVAVSVPQNRIAEAAVSVNALSGVSHNYQREHSYNLWFTLTLPPSVDREEVLRALAADIRPVSMLDLPAVRRFKARAFFDVEGGSYVPDEVVPDSQGASSLTVTDWAVIAELQRGMPIVREPFDVMARNIGIEVEELLRWCQIFKDLGIMRRYNAAVKHTSVGFDGNAMVCWSVPDEMVERAGRQISAVDEVSHCYERVKYEDWPYNLYTMIHGRTREDCSDAIRRISGGLGIDRYEVLFTAREFKKERIEYRPFVTDWQARRYYPVSLDVSGKRCVVIGGGEVALRKVNALLEHGAVVQVISPRLCRELDAMFAGGSIMAMKRDYRPGDVAGAFLAIAATDVVTINRRVAIEAEKHGVLVNVVDAPGLSNFIVPSYLRRGDLTLAVSTGGKSPALARRIRERLEGDFDEEYEKLLALTEQVRSELRRKGIVASGEDWQRALDIDALLALIRGGRTDDARRLLIEGLERRE